MKILINGEAHKCTAENLAILLTQLDFEDAVVATAVNGEFVAQNMRADCKLNEGDQIEILAPMQGG